MKMNRFHMMDLQTRDKRVILLSDGLILLKD